MRTLKIIVFLTVALMVPSAAFASTTTTTTTNPDGSTTTTVVTEQQTSSDGSAAPPSAKSKPPQKPQPKKAKPKKRRIKKARKCRFGFNLGRGPCRMVSYDQPTGNTCGPTALAMIGATLLHNRHIRPMRTRWAFSSSFTSATIWKGRHSMPERFGRRYHLRVHRIGRNFHRAIKTIRSGGLVLVMANPGKFTSKGHFFVLRRYKGGKLFTADPNANHNSFEKHGFTVGFMKSHKANVAAMWSFRK